MQLLAVAASFLLLHVTALPQECIDGTASCAADPATEGRALMQRKKETLLKETAKAPTKPVKRKKGHESRDQTQDSHGHSHEVHHSSHAQVASHDHAKDSHSHPHKSQDHSSRGRRSNGKVANLLASEMEEIAATRGTEGITPEEKKHINSIKDLIVGTILPSIDDGVGESRIEVGQLFEAITACSAHVTKELKETTSLQSDAGMQKELHKTCRKKEGAVRTNKEKVCAAFEKAKLGVHEPRLNFEISMDMSDSEMVKYLRAMDEHFCGRWSEFKDIWEECDSLTNNYTDTHAQCVTLQQEFEEAWCTWKSDLEETCEEFDHCWTTAVNRYNDRKTAIQQLQAGRIAEYEAAVKVNCLWDAWEWDKEPCTVNMAKVKQCNTTFAPNFTAIRIDYPEIPTPPACDTEPVSIYPCETNFLAEQYASIGVQQVLVDEMKEACTSCSKPLFPWMAWGPPRVLKSVTVTTVRHVLTTRNMKNLGNDIYMKNRGKDGECDAELDSPDKTDTFVGAQMLTASTKAELSLTSGEDAVTMTVENGMATAEGSTVLLTSNDFAYIKIVNGKVLFQKGQPGHFTTFASIDEPRFQAGSAIVKVCTKGASVKVDM